MDIAQANPRNRPGSKGHSVLPLVDDASAVVDVVVADVVDDASAVEADHPSLNARPYVGRSLSFLFSRPPTSHLPTRTHSQPCAPSPPLHTLRDSFLRTA